MELSNFQLGSLIIIKLPSCPATCPATSRQAGVYFCFLLEIPMELEKLVNFSNFKGISGKSCEINIIPLPGCRAGRCAKSAHLCALGTPPGRNPCSHLPSHHPSDKCDRRSHLSDQAGVGILRILRGGSAPPPQDPQDPNPQGRVWGYFCQVPI